MTFDINTRELTSSTGYIKSKDNTLYANHSIYLGIYDSKENYKECSEEDYNSWLEESEEQYGKDRNISQ